MTASESISRDGYARAGIVLVLVAIALRVIEYFHNKAIWLDEAHLALARRIVAMHGGTLRLEAREPRGVRAEIRLPFGNIAT